MNKLSLAGLLCVFLAMPVLSTADDDPIAKRQDVMQDVRKAAKPIGAMLRGQAEFDAETFEASLAVFAKSAAVYGDLFPEGSESGGDTEAAATIWSDRDGFNAEITKWADAVAAAQAAGASNADEFRAAAVPVMQTCKACHDGYRVDN